MKKRIGIVLVYLSTLLSLYGCASILDGEMQTATPHQDMVITATNSVIEAGTYDELEAEMIGFVSRHAEKGLINVYGYTGDVQQDVDAACAHIMHDEPIGAYAVSAIIGNATKIVSYYVVDIQILYKDVTIEQLESIIPVATVRYVKPVLQDALADYAPSATIITSNIALTSDDVLGYVEQIYYENPMDIVMQPITTVSFYPEHGPDQIIEFTFGYTNEISTLKVMENYLNNTVQSIAESVSGDTDPEILLYLCQHLMDTVKYDTATADSGEYSTQNTAATAYGALVTGSAVGEGYAMAYKALCDELGIECYVVLGVRDGKPNAWNIVALEDAYYHIDVSMCDLTGISTSFLLNDTEMMKTYTWDSSKYKICNGPLTYTSLKESATST